MNLNVAAAGGLSPEASDSLNSAVRLGANEEALIIYGRWWQLETWLRQVVDIELTAKYGARWAETSGLLDGRTTHRLTTDAQWTHMLGPDSENPLAFVDFSKLREILKNEWDIFAPVMPRESSWNGHVEELSRIRHRIAHLRQPHPDDLSRLEQALRDLERGAFIAAASFNTRSRPRVEDALLPLVKDWVLKQGEDAQRLVDHAENNYGVDFEIHHSRRPWAGRDSTAAAPGHFWHVAFYSRSSTIDFERVWHDDYFAQAKKFLLFMEADSQNRCILTFSAADPLQEISDSIGGAFEAILHASRSRNLAMSSRWRAGLDRVSYKLISDTMWNVIDDSTVPVTLFGTGMSTRRAPTW